MQSFLDTLKAAPKTAQAKINAFLTNFRPNSDKLAIFLEGRDDPSFFRVHISKEADERKLSVELVILGKKQEVLQARKFVEERFPNHPKIMFFVDKDHDDFLGLTDGVKSENNLFVTLHYSIENYLVSESAIRAILSDLWALDSSNPAIQLACDKFREFQMEYRNLFLPWMAWHIALRKQKYKPQIDNINASILEIDDNYTPIINWNPDIFTCLHKECKVSISVDQKTFNSVQSELNNLPTKSWLRGKQELWCLCIFLKKLEQEIKQSESSTKIKIRTQISLSNIVEIVAPRLKCPQDLKTYLTNRFDLISNSEMSN